MIYFYSGTPGSGKSLHLAQQIYTQLKEEKKHIIANIPIDIEYIRKHPFSKKKKLSTGRFYYLQNKHFSPQFFYNYAKKFHKKGIEGQTIIVIDEAQMLFSPSVVKLQCRYDPNFRVDWLDFFTQHRHLGFDIIIVSQFDRLIDPQIRVLFEYNYIHRKANNLSGIYPALIKFLGLKLFVYVKYWYGTNEKLGVSFYRYSKKYSKIYDSYNRFN